MSPKDARTGSNLKYRLAPALSAGTSAWTRLFGGDRDRFQTIILHDVPETQFDALGSFLHFVQQEHGFLTPTEAAQKLENPTDHAGRSGNSVPCLLTFDDGFASAVPVARKILSQFGIKAVFFVCPGLIDLPASQQERAISANIFRGAPPFQSVPSLMNWNDLQNLASEGHLIGAHGSRHLRLSTLEPNEIENEVADAGNRIAQQIGHYPEWYAYAFGGVDAISKTALAIIQQHYRYCRTGIRGSNGANNPPGLLNAQEIDLGADPSFHRAVLKSALDFRYFGARRTIRRYASNK